MFKRRFIIYVVTFTVIGAALLYGITFRAWNTNQAEDKELQEANVELINEWIIYLNSTNLYQYGVNINITNTGQSNLELSNLQINFTGTGRDKTWSTTYPTKDLVLAPGESKKVNIRSQSVL